MSMSDQFAVYEDYRRHILWADMYGYPKPHVKYPIDLIIVYTEGGSREALRNDVPDECSNPFFWEDVADVLFEKMPSTPGEIFKWSGYYYKYKNGRCRFSGKFERIPL